MLSEQAILQDNALRQLQVEIPRWLLHVDVLFEIQDTSEYIPLKKIAKVMADKNLKSKMIDDAMHKKSLENIKNIEQGNYPENDERFL